MKDQKRGKNVALGGAALQAVLAGGVLVLWRVTGSQAALSGLWLLLGGLPLWAMTALLFYARQVESQEALELDEIARRGGSDATIFRDEDRLALRPGRRRVALLQRWAVPAFTLLFAGYHAALSMLMLRLWRRVGPAELSYAGQATAFFLILGFAAFLFSRYCTGMGTSRPWRLLRAVGSYLLMCAVFTAAMAVGLLLASQGNTRGDRVIAWVLPLIELIFAAELVLNFVLDLYRPRLPGDEYRPSYDSRLFNFIAEPARVGHSIADTLNYQFGFEVSRTWFYQLVSRAFVPLIIFALAVLFLISSLVIVNDGEVYYVKTWGRLADGRTTLGPGIHLKWPWPISTAERFETGKVYDLLLGLGESKEPKLDRFGNQLQLWTEEHGYSARLETDFLIGAPTRRQVEGKDRDAREGEPPPVNIIKLVVLVQYQVVDPYAYGYTFSNPQDLISSVASQEMMAYCASATLDQKVSDNPDRPQAIMTFGRQAAARVLQKRLQARLDELNVGVNLLFVGILSAHPPVEAVPQFEKVLEAERLQDKQRYEAEAKANQTLAGVAGDPGNALKLYLALYQAEVFERLRRQKNQPAEQKQFLQDEIRRVKEQVEGLKREIAREALLGKGDEDPNIRPRVDLRGAYQAFLQNLESAIGDPKGFDYDARIAQADRMVGELLARLEGEPAKLLAEAQAYRWQRELKERTDLDLYRMQLLPFRAAPRMYRFDRYMDVLEETLPDAMKYVIGVARDRLEVRLNLETQEKDVFDTATEGQ